MIKRILEETLRQHFGKGKALIVLGARQVGKTTILRSLFDDNDSVLWLNGDDQDVRTRLLSLSSTTLNHIIGNRKVVVIDEAQRVSDIGLVLKIIVDNMPGVQVVATGSSSFDLANLTNEPLTGRKFEYKLFPLSFKELADHNGLLEEMRLLPHRLVYGSYPDVVNNPTEERLVLNELADSYLYKDILSFDKIKKSDKLVKLLQSIAFQIGSEVSYNELAQNCGIDAKTVESYIQLLEKSYIIFRLGSYSRNLRNELKFSRKIYFWDCGIRNSLIGNFLQPEMRQDMGALFENYMIAERLKTLDYAKSYAKSYFWRTTAKQEVDYIEEIDGRLSAFEFKWNPKKKASTPSSFAKGYPEAEFKVISRENFHEMLL